ncbi:MAG: SUMF1/EgtB/PvdO family nonheme iron enzyme [Cyanobacteria bacterium P01_E01_bin.6]
MGQAAKRGGSWNNNPRNCRSACRNNNNPGDHNNNIGFRVVCEARALFSEWCCQYDRITVPELIGGNLSSVPREESRPGPVMHPHPKSNQSQRA